MEVLRSKGFIVEKVEHWNAHAKRRVDLFGFADLIAARRYLGIILVQVTTSSHHAERRKKVLASENARVWREAGGRIQVRSWGKVKGLWTERIEEITFDDESGLAEVDPLDIP
jgi:hypothetical protein